MIIGDQMTKSQDKIRPFDYLGGKDFTQKLLQVLELERFNQLSDVIDIGQGTFSTWHTRQMTPFEVAVRVHLAKGVSLRWLLLDEGEPYENSSQTHISKKQESKRIFDIDCFDISKGCLTPLKTLSFDKVLLDEIGVLNVMAVKTNNSIYLVDKENRQAINGKYLIDIDGVLSLNELQRLPGKKLAISFNGSTINVEEDDIKVIGRVAMVMGKE